MRRNGNGKSFVPHNFTPGRDKDMRPLSFCRIFNFIQFSFEAFFSLIGTFGSIQRQSEPTFPQGYFIKVLWIFIENSWKHFDNIFFKGTSFSLVSGLKKKFREGYNSNPPLHTPLIGLFWKIAARRKSIGEKSQNQFAI